MISWHVHFYINQMFTESVYACLLNILKIFSITAQAVFESTLTSPLSGERT